MSAITHFSSVLTARLAEKMPLIQVLVGPRQVGKTTAAEELCRSFPGGAHMVSADGPTPPNHEWLREHWLRAREMPTPALFIVDEVQKIPGWSEVAKRMFDEDRSKRDLRVLFLGSSSLAIQRGLTESLAGRFELIRAYHWNFAEMKLGFDWTLDQYLCFGGYPGAVRFIREGDIARWQSYIRESILEPVLGKDLAIASSVSKPALFRQAFELSMLYPAQEVSYQKLLGQLQERGSHETLKHYLSLFEGAFLLRQVFRYSTRPLSTRTSSPKLLPLAPALISAFTNPRRLEVDPDWRGRVFEAAVGAALARSERELFTWRDGEHEVDFVIIRGNTPVAIEIKSGRKKTARGLDRFLQKFPNARTVTLTNESALPVLQGEAIK